MKQASVRFLASQDGQVLGADLYTQSAFDKLIKRAGAITDDMMREAHLLRWEAHPAKNSDWCSGPLALDYPCASLTCAHLGQGRNSETRRQSSLNHAP